MDTERDDFTSLQKYVTKLLQKQVDYESVGLGAFPKGTDSTKL